jgi:tripartite-type tricarboxylate transporter receptor subunit TctC
MRGEIMLRGFFAFAAALCVAAPASAQFYRGRTLTMVVNYGVGGNIDTEARIISRHLPKHLDGNPTVVIQNMPGAGGFHAMNMVGLNVNSKPDGMTAGFFTIGAIGPLIQDPALKVKIYDDFIPLAGVSGWTVSYVRKDIIPEGMVKPEDIIRAKRIFIGGYSRSSSHDTRMRLALEIMGLEYGVVTGFPGAGDINKAFLQNEINMTSSSMPAYQSQVVPNIIQTGIGMPLWHYPVYGKDGRAAGDPALTKAGIPSFTDVYRAAYGKDPSGPKYDAFMLMNDIGTKLLRGFFLPKGAPQQAAGELSAAFLALRNDPAFLEEYEKITKEIPEMIDPDGLRPVFEKMKAVTPEVRKILQDSVGG